MLDLQRLRIFQEVALCGSFSAAARKLNFSTSAVSQQIARLEREVGLQLIERRSNGAFPTPEGELLLTHADALVARAAEADADMRALRDGGAGTIRCTAFSSAIATLMPDAISVVRTVLPKVIITLVERNRRETIDGLRRNDFDLGVVARSGAGPDAFAREEIERVPLFVEKVDVVMSRKHALASAPSVALEDLADESWADCSDRPVRRFVGTNGAPPRIVFQGDLPVLLNFVAEGEAMCLLPRLSQRELPSGVIAKPIEPDPPTRRVEVAVRKNDTRPAVRSFISLIVDVARAYEDGSSSSVLRGVGVAVGAESEHPPQ
jgi:DNA-binding transcriptional LysR family regulator